jgi:hypothetical protein
MHVCMYVYTYASKYISISMSIYLYIYLYMPYQFLVRRHVIAVFARVHHTYLHISNTLATH